MSGTIFELENTTHQRVQKLLAFEGTLGRAERELVEQHAVACAQCRDDLAWQRKLKGIEPAAGAHADMDAALARLMPQLTPQQARGPRTGRWMGWAIAAQLLLIAGLGVQLLGEEPEYRLLAAPAQTGAQANIIVRFAANASEQQIRTVLRQHGARVVDGPTAGDAWLLRVAPDQVEGAARSLRGEPALRMAEPLQVAP